MRLTYIGNSAGLILKYISLVMLVPCLVALYYQDYFSIIPFVTASIVSLILGFVLYPKKSDFEELNNIKRSEALFIAVAAWLLFSIIATIPYLFYKMSLINAVFEAVSGITSTGATILSDFSIYPKTMFFWRSFSQWLGGMGIIVLFIAILPQFGVAGREMFVAEATGKSTDQKFTPRIRQTASALWKIYTMLTIIQIGILKWAGMPLFDACCNSLSTLSSGGFSPHSHSIAGYGNPIFVWVIIIFMFLSGISFALQYKIITQRKPFDLFKDEEFRYYFGIIVLFSISLAVLLFVNHQFDIVTSIREAFFQVISILTTTGFASSDFEQWCIDGRTLLYILMFIGGCAGSTAGGIKIIRLIFISKFIKREIAKIHHPNAVFPIKINKKSLSPQVIEEMIVFIIFYYMLFAITTLLVVMIEKNLVIGLTGSISTLGNIGPCFGLLGPMESFDFLHPITKIIFIMNMLVGRLELIPFLAILHPDFWNFKK